MDAMTGGPGTHKIISSPWADALLSHPKRVKARLLSAGEDSTDLLVQRRRVDAATARDLARNAEAVGATFTGEHAATRVAREPAFPAEDAVGDGQQSRGVQYPVVGRRAVT